MTTPRTVSLNLKVLSNALPALEKNLGCKKKTGDEDPLRLPILTSQLGKAVNQARQEKEEEGATCNPFNYQVCT